jgi:hypothetical protein
MREVHSISQTVSAALDSPSSLLPSQYYFASSLIGYIFCTNVYFCCLSHNTGSSLSLTVQWESICRAHPKLKFRALLFHRPAWCECIFTRHLIIRCRRLVCLLLLLTTTLYHGLSCACKSTDGAVWAISVIHVVTK